MSNSKVVLRKKNNFKKLELNWWNKITAGIPLYKSVRFCFFGYQSVSGFCLIIFQYYHEWVLPHRNSIERKIFINMKAHKYCYLKQSEQFWKDNSIFWKNEWVAYIYDEFLPLERLCIYILDRIMNIKSKTRNNSNVICVITNKKCIRTLSQT